MKPLKLTMQAFGSYAERTEIDFSELDSSLYLIRGNTGSGKSTIFDAIVFALYGELSGGYKNESVKKSISKAAVIMHSDYADRLKPIEVILDFEHSGSTYHVERIVKYSKSGKSSITAVFTESGGSIEGTASVNRKITGLLGIDPEQFRQIVMLAQGDFSRFLRSKSDEKSRILGRMFDDSPYIGFQNRLKDAERKIGERYENCSKAVQTQLSVFEAPSDLSDDEKSLYNQYNPELEENIESLINREKDRCGVMSKEKSEYKKKHIELINKRALAESRNKKIIEYEQCVKMYEEYQNQKPMFDNRRKAKDKAAAAYRQVKPFENKLTEKRKELAISEKELVKLNNSLLSQKEKIEECERDIESNKAFEAEIENIKKNMAVLESEMPKYEELDNLKKDYTTARKNKSRTELNKNNIDRELSELKAMSDESKQKLEPLRDADVILVQSQHNFESARKKYDDITDMFEKIKKIVSADNKLNKLKEALKCQTETASGAMNTYNTLYNLFINGQAGILAKSLSDDIDKNGIGICPVCHSEFKSGEHHFAELNDNIPTQSEVSGAKDNWDAAERKRAEIYNDVTQRESRVNSNKETAAEKACEFFSGITWDKLADKSFRDSQCMAAENELNKYEEEYENARNNSEIKKTLEKRIDEINSKLDEKSGLSEQINKEYELISKELTVLETSISERAEHLTYKSKKSAETKYKEFSEKSDNLQLLIDTAKKSKEKADNKYSKISGSIDRLRENIEKLKDLSDTLNIDYQKAVLTYGFNSEEEYHGALDTITGNDGEEWIKNEENEIRKFDDAVTRLNTRVSELKKETAEFKMTDISGLESEISGIEDRINTLDKSLNLQNGLISNHSKVLEEIKKQNAQMKKLKPAYESIKILSELANGVSSEGGRVSFERYVMGMAFKEILEQANYRLNEMSGGRYELMHRVGGNDANKIAGLDINVFDANTGKERTADSLSGGETFTVSMSLALGLSDVVQNHAGGCRIDSMFIDEGFGSLDDAFLNNVLKTLSNLSGGKVQLGIISHIDSLKGRIPQQIVVEKDHNGSRVTILK